MYNKKEETKSPMKVKVMNNPMNCSGIPIDFKNKTRINEVAPNPMSLSIRRMMRM
jgi:hypothetical protein